jgi:uncharacterized protein YfaS (alpha-2-macroglobulin family)
VQVKPNANLYRVETTVFNEKTDNDGQVILGPDKMPSHFSWLATASKAKDGQGGVDRLAYLGFSYIWFGQRYDPEYNATRVMAITDRPVYRPDQTVHFKAWVRHAKYDEADTSSFAGKDFEVRVTNPKGEKLIVKTLTADEYGGIEGDCILARGAMLGMYITSACGSPAPMNKSAATCSASRNTRSPNSRSRSIRPRNP